MARREPRPTRYSVGIFRRLRKIQVKAESLWDSLHTVRRINACNVHGLPHEILQPVALPGPAPVISRGEPAFSNDAVLAKAGASSRTYSASKVIHRWRGEPGLAHPQPPVNNFVAAAIYAW